MNDFPSLIGRSRLKAQNCAQAEALFTWAFSELRKTVALVAKSPKNKKLLYAAADTASAINEKLQTWEPSNGPN